jgi:hypothetical protein
MAGCDAAEVLWPTEHAFDGVSVVIHGWYIVVLLPGETIPMTGKVTAAESLPTTAVVRVSRASYDPSRFAEVDAASKKTSEYIIPAIRRLPGLLHFYAGVSPKGSVVQVSVWDTDEHAAQLDRLKEMVIDGRRDMEAVGVTFTPIFNYPIDWTWTV